MRAVAAGVTDVGKERDHNEDRFVLLPEFEVFVVADGMGGHQCGEVASRMATSTIANYFRALREQGKNGNVPEVLRASLNEANDRIHRRAGSSPLHRGMGTTVVAAAFHREENKLYVAHAGDSRCYRMRQHALHQLTRDHSLIEEALRTRPDITKSELAYLPANVITRALGVEAQVDVEVTVDDVRLGDTFLLCSDGLHGFVTDDRIQEILRIQTILTDACSELVAEANKNGGGDNITAVLVRIEEVDEPWAIATSVPRGPHESDEPGDDDSTDDDTEKNARRDLRAAEAIGADDTAKMPPLHDPDAVLGGSPDDDDPDDDPATDPPDDDDGLRPPPLTDPPDSD